VRNVLLNFEELCARKIVIYGDGNSRHVFQSFVLNKINESNRPEIILVVDRKYSIEALTVDGLPATNPNKFMSAGDLTKNFPVVVCIGSTADSKDVIDNLRATGFNRVYSMYEFESFHCAYGSQDYEEVLEEINGRSTELNLIKDILSDDLSVLVFNQYFDTFRFRKIPTIFCSPKNDEQLGLEIGFFESLNKTNVLSCGAYTGDSVIRMLDNISGEPESIVLIEPSIDSYEIMLKNLSNVRVSSKLIALPIGLSDEVQQIEFAGFGVTYKAEKNSKTPVSNRALFLPLDGLFSNFNFTHLLIDVEGNELKFLEGAKNIIRKYKPRICISAYHRPLDILDLAQSILRLNNDYKLFLRNYSGVNTDTLLYAM